MEVTKGYKGISFPFRFNSAGGVATSTTSPDDFTHIRESIEQIIRTKRYERVMEPDFYCELDPALFENIDDTSTQGILAFSIKEAIERLDDRVEIQDITFEVDNEGEIIANITFLVKKYLKTEVTKIPLGGGSE